MKKNNTHYQVELALKSQDLQLLNTYLSKDLIDFQASYGAFGTAIDYAIQYDNIQMLHLFYEHILTHEVSLENISHNKNYIQQHVIETIAKIDKEINQQKKQLHVTKVAMLLQMNLLDFEYITSKTFDKEETNFLDLAFALKSDSLSSLFILYIFVSGKYSDEQISNIIPFKKIADEVNKNNYSKIEKIFSPQNIVMGINRELIFNNLLQYGVQQKAIEDIKMFIYQQYMGVLQQYMAQEEAEKQLTKLDSEKTKEYTDNDEYGIKLSGDSDS